MNALSSKAGSHVSLAGFSVQLIWSLQCLAVRGPVLQMSACNQLQNCWTNSVNLYNKYIWWLWQFWITGCLCFIFLFGFITKAKELPLFSSSLHHLFRPKAIACLCLCSSCIFPVYSHFQYQLRTVHSGVLLSITIWDGFLGNNNYS